MLPSLAAYIRQTNLITGKPVILADDWKSRAREHANTPIPRKLELLLRVFEQESRFAGQTVQLDFTSATPLVDAVDPKETAFLVDTLFKEGLLEEELGDLRLSAAGWNQLHPISGGGVPGTAFIAMSFHPDLDDAYADAIEPAIKACGFSVNRVDRRPHNEQITDRIVAGIHSAQFVVADFTGQRQSVYYEAGLAQGLRKPVIRTCCATDFDHLHFDTRQYLHIRWSTPTELRERLEDHIGATIGIWGSVG